jgi:hypothetical protein
VRYTFDDKHLSLRSILCGAVLFVAGCDDFEMPVPPCPSRSAHVSVDEPLEALGGESVATRFDEVAAPWDCVVDWLELPETIGRSEPPAGDSVLTLELVRTSETASYRERALTPEESYDATECPKATVSVATSLGLTSEDGALDETFDTSFAFQGENTLLNVTLDSYEFMGTHTVAFADGSPRDYLELSLAFTPGPAPERIDGSMVESAVHEGRGQDPIVTTAVIECTRVE